MSGGDPVEEGGAAVRQGFIQAFQTGSMVANAMQRRAGEARSATEHHQRVQDSADRGLREQQIHWAKLQGYADRQWQGQRLFELDEKLKLDDGHRKQTLHERQVEGYDNRERWGQAEHEADLEVKSEQIRRGNHDLARRDAEFLREQQRHSEVHTEKIQGYQTRAEQSAEVHKLDVKYKELLIEIRRRAAGFADDLSSAGRVDAEAMKAAAGFAAAEYTADLSGDHAAHAQAYRERFTADTGLDAEDILDDLDTEIRHKASNPGPEILDAEIVGAAPQAPAPASLLDVVDAEIITDPDLLASLHAVAGLTEDLTTLAHADHDAPIFSEQDASSEPGARIGEAIHDAGLTGEVGIGLDPEPEVPAPGLGPGAGIEAGTQP
ncbi:hypothetical protein [Nocardia sp. NPDC050435]|uniref:hypothetical protein n=1 Tax=Nocardia sp. NPDC050435 TaxID=3155040 RepID=UPI00340E88AE